jgi:hypothetical protein
METELGTMKTVERAKRILDVAERRIERLRSHAGVRNRTIDRLVVGLTELRASMARRVAK